MKKIFLLTLALFSYLTYGQNRYYRHKMRVAALYTGNVPINHVSDPTTGNLANPNGRTIITDYIGEYVDRKIVVFAVDEYGDEYEAFDYSKGGPDNYFYGVDIQDVAGNIGDGFSPSTLPTGFREFAAAYGGQNGALSSHSDNRFTIAGTYVGSPKDFEVRLTIVKSNWGFQSSTFGRTYYIHRMINRTIEIEQKQTYFDNQTPGTIFPITVKVSGAWKHYVKLIVKDDNGNVIQEIGEQRTSGVEGNNSITFTPTQPIKAGTIEAQIIYHKFGKNKTTGIWEPDPNNDDNTYPVKGPSTSRILKHRNTYINPNLRVIIR